MDTEKTVNGAGESSPAPDGSDRYPVFTIPQIRHYLTRGVFTRGDDPDGAHLPENTALRALIAELEDREDGIEAVTARSEWREPNAGSDASASPPIASTGLVGNLDSGDNDNG